MLLLLKDFCKVGVVHLKQDGLMEPPTGLQSQENWPERLHLALDGKIIFKDESQRTGLLCDLLHMVVPSSVFQIICCLCKSCSLKFEIPSITLIDYINTHPKP